MMLHYSGSVPSQVLYQRNYPTNYFHLPLANKILLAGNFGELRPNHFHSGWDIKTNNTEGYPVHAAQLGFVSRIKLAKKGYGLAVYITHPNGFTTVYAHLSKLNNKLNIYLKAEQQKQNKNEVDFNIKANELKISNDEIVAYSGNSGSSEAPHLHFEIRDAFTEEAINPSFFRLPINDDEKPLINKIGIYSWNENTDVSNFQIHTLSTIEINEEEIKKCVVVKNPIIGVAVAGFDVQNNTNDSKLGLTSITLLQDNNKICHIYFDRLNFAETKRINFMVDTIQQKKKNVDWYKLYLPKLNVSSFYKNKNEGKIVLEKNKMVNFKIIVSDFTEHKKTLKFSVIYKPNN
ncbi:MAG: hypothetical protein RJA07_2409 [Bacteroidota bacterium]